jgi:signal transduction histidine kinase
VYRDGFRIWPYGEPSNDWLRLDQRRVNNPVVCLSNNQVVGFVEISRDRNPELMDQTNREGLIQNQALEDLRRCVEHTFHLLEDARQRVRHPRDRESRGARENRVASTVDALEQIATSVDSRTRRDIKRIVGEARATAEREHAEKRRLEQAYADLAAAGEAAIGIGSTVSGLFERLSAELAPSVMRVGGPTRKLLEEIAAYLAMLSDVGAPGSHKRRTMDVSAELDTFRQVMVPLLASQNVTMRVVPPRTDLVRVDINPHTFRRVLHILLSNSLDWLVRTRDPAVTIEVNGSRDECSIAFCDNGPGIRRELAARVFEPLFTTKEGGRGMGLTIARALVEKNGGRVELDVDGRRRGARILLTFPRKRARATVHA